MKFHTDDFERMLREVSDEFRMYPSKRIWNSIYNNIHPGRKWPSVVMTICLIFTLNFVGYLNTSDTTADPASISKTLAATTSNSIPPKTAELLVHLLNESAPSRQSHIAPNNFSANGPKKTSTLPSQIALPAKLLTAATESITKVVAMEISDKNHIGSLLQSPSIASNQLFNKSALPSGSLLEKQIGIDEEGASTAMVEDQASSPAHALKTRGVILPDAISSKGIFNSNAYGNMAEILQHEISSLRNEQLVQNNQDAVSQNDREWIENYALHNRRVPKKWAGKLYRQLYATPSVVYRSLSSGKNYSNPISNSPYATANQALNDALNQIPAMGMEIGAGLKYSILKGLSLKGGLQLNYTRYTTNAFENSHPFSTQITLHDFATNNNYEIYKTTPYSNQSGLKAVKLHNETFQLSLPIGADLKLAGNEKIQWSIGATIQPTFVMGGKNYLISSDKRNYVKGTDLLSKWNLNAGLETFITFQSNELTWQIGPQFRTQLFSTNSKQYVVEERLVNYGIKLGVSKVIR